MKALNCLTGAGSAIGAALAMWAVQVGFAVAGTGTLPAPWDRLVGCATIVTSIWALLRLRDRARERDKPRGQYVTDDMMDLILRASADGYRAGKADLSRGHDESQAPGARLSIVPTGTDDPQAR